MSSSEPSLLGVIPYLMSPDCKKHLDWITNVLGGKTKDVVHKSQTDSKVLHSCVLVNEGMLYLSDSETDEVTDVENLILQLSMEDVSDTWKRAQAAGATAADLGDPGTRPYRQFRDPFGFMWRLSEGRADGVKAHLVAPPRMSCESLARWVTEVYGGNEIEMRHGTEGKISHCEMSVNGGALSMSDSPQDGGAETSGTPPLRFILHTNIDQPKQTWERALEKGAISLLPMAVQDWGDLYGMLRDKSGFHWGIREAKDDTTEVVHGVIPTFMSPDCNKHIEWIKTVFSGKVRQLYRSPDQKVAHCMMEINRGYLYLCDTSCVLEQANTSLGEPRGVMFQLECADPEPIWKAAMSNQATEVVPLKMQFWGDVFGSFRDPFGYEWSLRKSVLISKKSEDNGKEDK